MLERWVLESVEGYFLRWYVSLEIPDTNIREHPSSLIKVSSALLTQPIKQPLCQLHWYRKWSWSLHHGIIMRQNWQQKTWLLLSFLDRPGNSLSANKPTWSRLWLIRSLKQITCQLKQLFRTQHTRKVVQSSWPLTLWSLREMTVFLKTIRWSLHFSQSTVFYSSLLLTCKQSQSMLSGLCGGGLEQPWTLDLLPSRTVRWSTWQRPQSCKAIAQMNCLLLSTSLWYYPDWQSPPLRTVKACWKLLTSWFVGACCDLHWKDFNDDSDEHTTLRTVLPGYIAYDNKFREKKIRRTWQHVLSKRDEHLLGVNTREWRRETISSPSRPATSKSSPSLHVLSTSPQVFSPSPPD